MMQDEGKDEPGARAERCWRCWPLRGIIGLEDSGVSVGNVVEVKNRSKIVVVALPAAEPQSNWEICFRLLA